MTAEELAAMSCQSRKAPDGALDEAKRRELLEAVDGWNLADDGKSIGKDFKFKNFHHTLGFMGAVGWMANQQDHHPDLEAGYGHCRVRWSTHDVGGLSLNDFICAARVDTIAGS